MRKAYLFEASKVSKAYGDCSPVLKTIVVVGAATKAAAKEQALKCAAGLRIANAGREFANEVAARAEVESQKKLSQSLLDKGFTQYGPVPESTVIDLDQQRGIARLLGL